MPHKICLHHTQVSWRSLNLTLLNKNHRDMMAESPILAFCLTSFSSSIDFCTSSTLNNFEGHIFLCLSASQLPSSHCRRKATYVLSACTLPFCGYFSTHTHTCTSGANARGKRKTSFLDMHLEVQGEEESEGKDTWLVLADPLS